MKGVVALATESMHISEAEGFFDDLIGMTKLPEYYRKIERKLKNEEKDEKIAISLGFVSDNYYTAKEKMFAENERDIILFEARAPISRSSGRS